MKNAIILDTETDALHGRAVELAWISPNLGTEFLQRYNPDRPIDPGAEAVHHISDAEVADMPLYNTFTMPDGTEYIIGHNIDYDAAVIERGGIDISKYKFICTLALARRAWPELKVHKLGALIEFLIGGEDAKLMLENAHSALADVKMTHIILLHIIQKMCLSDNPLMLYIASEEARIPTHMPFGKWKGTPLAQVDQGYIRWALENMDLDKYLRKALQSAQQVRL